MFGVGSGMLLSSVNFGIQTISRSEDCGRAACMYTFVRSMGMSIGVAVSPFRQLNSRKLMLTKSCRLAAQFSKT